MPSAHDVDWAAFPPGPDNHYFPEKVASAIQALAAVAAEIQSGEPYQTLLNTIANNHGGYLYPASCAAIPLIGDVLEMPGWPRSTALAVLINLACFDAPPTFILDGEAVDFAAPVRERFEALREKAQAIAAGPDDGAGSCQAAQEYIDALDERVTLKR